MSELLFSLILTFHGNLQPNKAKLCSGEHQHPSFLYANVFSLTDALKHDE